MTLCGLAQRIRKQTRIPIVKVSLFDRCAALIPWALVLVAAYGSPTVCPAILKLTLRIQGLKPGRAVVTPTYRTGRSADSATTVTVVP